ncbi:MAG: hypothetical protein IT371_16160 [Deltaproteobacteria bacterium]|nr:hypothetical protein [Deltaproteobacteria bacterium]
MSGATCQAGRCVCPTGQAWGCGALGAPKCADFFGPTDCGLCYNTCGPGTTCLGGTCQCTAPSRLCRGSCVNPQKDPANCGSCDSPCGKGQVCSKGACSATCASGLSVCGASCVDFLTDAEHCGGCYRKCAARSKCVAGTCS